MSVAGCNANPAFNTPVKVGFGFIALFFFGTFGTWIIRIALERARHSSASVS